MKKVQYSWLDKGTMAEGGGRGGEETEGEEACNPPSPHHHAPKNKEGKRQVSTHQSVTSSW